MSSVTDRAPCAWCGGVQRLRWVPKVSPYNDRYAGWPWAHLLPCWACDKDTPRAEAMAQRLGSMAPRAQAQVMAAGRLGGYQAALDLLRQLYEGRFDAEDER